MGGNNVLAVVPTNTLVIVVNPPHNVVSSAPAPQRHDSATSPRRDADTSDEPCSTLMAATHHHHHQNLPACTALFAAHALVDLSLSNLCKPVPQVLRGRAEIGVQTDPGDFPPRQHVSRRSSPGRSSGQVASRKRNTEVQTRLTVRSRRKVKNCVVQTSAGSGSGSGATTPKRSRKSPCRPLIPPPTPASDRQSFLDSFSASLVQPDAVNEGEPLPSRGDTPTIDTRLNIDVVDALSSFDSANVAVGTEADLLIQGTPHQHQFTLDQQSQCFGQQQPIDPGAFFFLF